MKVTIVGGGVIGLSLAWELLRRGNQVLICDRNRFGRKASWAGAGILAPANRRTMTQPLDRLMGLGNELHKQWSVDLLKETGIDNGYRESGGLYIARTPGEQAALAGLADYWRQYQIPFESPAPVSICAKISGLNCGQQSMSIWVPGEFQIHNPDHLRALRLASQRRGAKLVEQTTVEILQTGSPQPEIRIAGEIQATDAIAVCAGAWAGQLLEPLGINVPIVPVRGQMLLYHLDHQTLTFIINEGSRYIVPREDGHVLVGSTTEEVGFDESTVPAAIEQLQQFAVGTVESLAPERLVRSWAGLRPASHDGFPLIGAIEQFPNLYMATGHFRSGLQMSTATAVLLADQITGESSDSAQKLKLFAPDRIAASESGRKLERTSS